MSSSAHFEAALVSNLVTDVSTLGAVTHFILKTAFPCPEHPFSQNVWVAANVLREAVGLSPGQKPGDIDILIVPDGPMGPQLDKVMAAEVKIVRPTLANPGRNANSYGRSQASGLLRDGFPFVGLLHLVLPEPLPSEYLFDVPHIAPRPGQNGEPILTGETSKVDFFPRIAAERQQLRLEALDLPQAIAFTSIGIQLSEENSRLFSHTLGHSRTGLRNFNTSSVLLQNIGRYLISGKMKKIVWLSR